MGRKAVDRTAQASKRRTKLIGIGVTFVIIVIAFFLFNNSDTGENRTEQDYVTNTYVVGRIIEKQTMF